MLVRMPDYAETFQCLAGDCPHSCCIGWEVVLDEEHTALYEAVEGALGEKLRAAMAVDDEGNVCFPLRGGRCPFLNRENLCEIHCALGEPATSITCQEHPRFIEDYGTFREVTFSASCPAANELLLGSRDPLRFVETENEESCGDEDAWIPFLLPLRQRLLDILADRMHPLPIRLGRFLALAEAAVVLLDEERVEELPPLAKRWQETAEEPVFPSEGLEFLAGLEVLEPDWREILRRAEAEKPAAVPEELLERIGAYFAFRYLLKCVNDGDILSRARLCVFSLLAVERIAAVCGLGEALRRFSREVEHSEENVDALLEALALGELPL